MKRWITALAALLCVISVILTSGKAAGTVYFSVINNTILPLDDTTMPRFYGGQIYLPSSFFSSEELGVYSVAGAELARIYSGAKILNFDVSKGTITDQNDTQYYSYSPRSYSGIVYVPANFVCGFFGLMQPAVIDAEPADIVRVRTNAQTINDATFAHIESIKTQLQDAYDKYTGVPISSASPTSPEPVEPTYPDVYVYLSFFDLSGGRLKSILDKLASANYKACFFVTADEMAANADLLRHAVCKGHTIGVRLTSGTADGAYREYQEVSALLFEAAQVRTVLVTAIGDTAEDAEAAVAAENMARERSLVYWRVTKSYEAGARLSVAGLTGGLSTVKGTRESLCFACADKTADVLRSFLSYLSQQKYSVRRIVETSIPILSA